MRTLTVRTDYFEHVLNCLANQKFLHEMKPEDRDSGQAAIDRAWKDGMALLSARGTTAYGGRPPKFESPDHVAPQPAFAHRYVVGFLFNEHADEVVLIEKKRPAWQAGKLNGVGGKIRDDESPTEAMRREFREEAGVYVHGWREFCELWSGDAVIHFFTATLPPEDGPHDDGVTIVSSTDELVCWYKVADIRSAHPGYPLVSNVPWLMTLALGQPVVAQVIEL